MNKVAKLILISCLYPAVSFAGFTTEKGKLDFAAEYTIGKTNQSNDNNEVEVDAEYGLFKDFSLGANFFYSTFRYFNDVIEDSTRSNFTRFSVYQKSNFDVNDQNSFGFRNRVQFVNEDSDEKYTIYDFRAVYLNNSSYGIYDSFRFDLGYARVFDGSRADFFVNEIHVNFSLSERIGFHSRIESAFLIAGNTLAEEIGTDIVNERGSNIFKSKPIEVMLFAGPEYQLNNDLGVVYIYGRMQIGGRDKTHNRGLVLGYAKTLF